MAAVGFSEGFSADAVAELTAKARAAARVLAKASTKTKNDALNAMAASLRKKARGILAANAKDMKAAEKDGKNAAFLDRLRLDEARLEAMAKALEAIVALPDPIGEVTDHWRTPNALSVEKVRLPLGVVLMIYEARPNVTSDAGALCLKSGNACILRGGKESLRSNRAIAEALGAGLVKAGLPAEAITLVPWPEHEAMLELISKEGRVDLCIPRGGEKLIRFVTENARVPVVKHYQGVCHVYVDASADLEMAKAIVLDGKVSRPGVCNALECLLVHKKVAGKLLPELGAALVKAKVELRAEARALEVFKGAKVRAKAATEADFGFEFLDLILAVKVVDGFDAALEHIARYGSEHTEAIVTRDLESAERFTREVAASGVMVNASTRFNDGGQLGLGAEIGISTSRLHAFGPMGLRELTSQKYVVRGQGQVRR